jgi:cytochrome c peroxidase
MTLKTPISMLPPTRTRPTIRTAWLAASVGLVLLHGAVQAADTSPARQLERFSAQAATPGQAERGRVLFTSRQGGEWSCSSCHGNPPIKPGKHASTGKTIDPMAPAANANAFTDTAKVDKWFRRNCKDVLQRECSAGEKADVLAYVMGLKP